MTAQEVYSVIKAHIQSQSSNATHPDWYVGIAADPKDALFNRHNVSEKNAWWIHRPADSEKAARSAEKTLIENLGTKGDTGGGDSNTTHVYAYQITTSTNED